MSRLLWLAYRLRTHRFGEWPLDRYPPVLTLGASALILVRWWWRGMPALPFWHWAVLAVLLLAGVTSLLVAAWAARRMYVVFKPSGGEAVQPGALALDPEDKVLTHVTGRLEVGGRERLFAGLLAYWRTFATREHTVMAIAHATRFLVVGRTLEENVGMWYLFVRPAAIESISPGTLSFGSGPRPALRVVHRVDQDAPGEPAWRERSPGLASRAGFGLESRAGRRRRDTFYLTFDDERARDCVWADLLADG